MEDDFKEYVERILEIKDSINFSIDLKEILQDVFDEGIDLGVSLVQEDVELALDQFKIQVGIE